MEKRRCLLLEVAKTHKVADCQQIGLAGFDDSKTIGQAVDLLIAAKKAKNCRPRYVESLEYYLNQFAKGRENLLIASFTMAEVESWMSKYPSAYSRRTWLSRLSPLFSFCVRKGFILANPCDRVDRVIVDMLPPLILTPAQADLMLKIVPTICRPYLILAMFAGIRPEEITRMDWAAINLETKTAKVDGKTRRRRIVPLEPRAVALLAACPLRSGPVAPSAMTLRRFKHKARAALGLARFPQDLFRHTFASYALALHGDAGKVSTAMGNSSGVLLSHYHEPVNAADCAAFWGDCHTMSDKVTLAGGASASKLKPDGKINRTLELADFIRIKKADSGTGSQRAAER